MKPTAMQRMKNDFPLENLRQVESDWGDSGYMLTERKWSVTKVDNERYESNETVDSAYLLDMAIVGAEVLGHTTILLSFDDRWETYKVETFDQWVERHDVHWYDRYEPAAYAQLQECYKSGLHFCHPDLLIERQWKRPKDPTRPVTPDFFLRKGMVEQAVRLAALRGYTKIGIGVDYGRGHVYRDTTLRDFKVVDGEIHVETMATGLESWSTINAPAAEVAAAYHLKVKDGGHWWMTVS